MIKTCNQCKTSFEISDDDLKFLERLSPIINGKQVLIPVPTFCSDCRQRRRLAYRNERNLYPRKCDKCGKNIISMYSPTSKAVIYCPECWYGDQWDARDYAVEYDFSKSFFEQWNSLRSKVPRLALHVSENENSTFLNQCWFVKNTYLTFDAGFCENTMYSYIAYHSKDIVDSLDINDSELCYELVSCNKCYNSKYLQDCNNCSDSYFSFDCTGCSNILFCTNLRNRKYCIYNKEVSKNEFEQMINEIFSGSYEKISKAFLEYNNIKLKAIHRANHNINIDNCDGDYIKNSKNCLNCFDCNKSEDLRFVSRVEENAVHCMDMDNVAFLENCYEGMMVAGRNNHFGYMVLHGHDNYYCDLNQNTTNCFGCVALKNKEEYFVLNKKYSREEYEKLILKIIEKMTADGEFGEYLNPKYSFFGYNETFAQEIFPLTQEQAISLGFNWLDYEVPNPKVEKVIQASQIPDKLENIDEKILDYAISCSESAKLFKIAPQELAFYLKHRLPLPRLHPNIRHNKRMEQRTNRKIFDRKCMKCGEDIKTSYVPERKEIVYCEDCYQKEVY